jgi:hypothetical protein
LGATSSRGTLLGALARNYNLHSHRPISETPNAIEQADLLAALLDDLPAGQGLLEAPAR